MGWQKIEMLSALDVLRQARDDQDLDRETRERVEWLLEECDDE
jgi:hypothetical protein